MSRGARRHHDYAVRHRRIASPSPYRADSGASRRAARRAGRGRSSRASSGRSDLCAGAGQRLPSPRRRGLTPSTLTAIHPG